jgi:hypothetical protein
MNLVFAVQVSFSIFLTKRRIPCISTNGEYIHIKLRHDIQQNDTQHIGLIVTLSIGDTQHKRQSLC